MTQARFPSLVGLRLRAFGAKPPSEILTLLNVAVDKCNCSWFALTPL